MLIVFRSTTAASITMFGEVGTALLKLMGQSGVTPGALQGADVGAALARLKAGVAGTPRAPAASDDHDDDEGADRIDLSKRAIPLIDLLERSSKAGVDVVWEKG